MVDAGDTYLIVDEKRIPGRCFSEGYYGFNLLLTMSLILACDAYDHQYRFS